MHRLKQAQLCIPEIVVESILFHPQLNHAVSLLPPVINNCTSGPNLEIMPLCTAKWTCFFSLQRDAYNCITVSSVSIVWKNLFAVLTFSTVPQEKSCKSVWYRDTLHLNTKYQLARGFTHLTFLPGEFISTLAAFLAICWPLYNS